MSVSTRVAPFGTFVQSGEVWAHSQSQLHIVQSIAQQCSTYQSQTLTRARVTQLLLQQFIVATINLDISL